VAVFLALVAGLAFVIASSLVPSKYQNIAQDFYPFLVLVILMGLVSYVIGIKSKLEEQHETEIYLDEIRASQYIQNYISIEKPRKVDLLEYAGHWANSNLALLKTFDCKLRLLIKNPNFENNEFQKKRIQDSIRALAIMFEFYNDMEIRAYRVNASLRARKFGDTLLCMGWFTHTYHERGIIGHENPMIITSLHGNRGRNLELMFNRVFEECWSQAEKDDDIVFVKGQLNPKFKT